MRYYDNIVGILQEGKDVQGGGVINLAAIKRRKKKPNKKAIFCAREANGVKMKPSALGDNRIAPSVSGRLALQPGFPAMLLR